jgi:hypothetical protein
MNTPARISLIAALLCAATVRADTPVIPDWALPGSATHQQVPPPADFRRASRTDPTPLGPFEGQTDIGGAVIAGSSSFDPASGRFTINSAGYNIWYFRDEFRFLWKKVSGDVSLAASVTFPVAGGYGDRKAVLVLRQSLDDDSKEIMAALHGAGLIHLAERPATGANLKEDVRLENKARDGGVPVRLGIERQGDSVSLLVSLNGEPMHRVGGPATFHLDGTYYVGVGFCSHQPGTSDTTVLSDVVLENAAGRVR